MFAILAAAVLAHPAPPAPPAVDHPPGTTVIREVRVVRSGDGKDAVARPGDGRQMVIRRDGGELTVRDCADGRKFETSASGEKDGKKTQTRIVLCGKKDATDASYAEVLDNAAKRIAADQELPADVRNRVVASINAEIARLNVSR